MINARGVMNALISLVVSWAEPSSNSTAYIVSEQVGPVAVELGSLVSEEGVLDGQGVQAELVRDDPEVRLVGVMQVEPDEGVRVGVQVLAQLLGGESLLLQLPVPV